MCVLTSVLSLAVEHCHLVASHAVHVVLDGLDLQDVQERIGHTLAIEYFLFVVIVRVIRKIDGLIDMNKN